MNEIHCECLRRNQQSLEDELDPVDMCSYLAREGHLVGDELLLYTQRTVGYRPDEQIQGMLLKIQTLADGYNILLGYLELNGKHGKLVRTLKNTALLLLQSENACDVVHNNATPDRHSEHCDANNFADNMHCDYQVPHPGCECEYCFGRTFVKYRDIRLELHFDAIQADLITQSRHESRTLDNAKVRDEERTLTRECSALPDFKLLSCISDSAHTSEHTDAGESAHELILPQDARPDIPSKSRNKSGKGKLNEAIIDTHIDASMLGDSGVGPDYSSQAGTSDDRPSNDLSNKKANESTTENVDNMEHEIHPLKAYVDELQYRVLLESNQSDCDADVESCDSENNFTDEDDNIPRLSRKKSRSGNVSSITGSEVENIWSLPKSNIYTKKKEMSFLVRVFDSLSTMTHQGESRKFLIHRDNLLKANPHNNDLRFTLTYLSAGSHLWRNQYEETDEVVRNGLQVARLTSQPSRALVEILSSRAWMYFQQKKYNRLRLVLDDAMATIASDPGGCVGAAAGWICVDQARLLSALMSGNHVDRILRMRQEGIDCLEKARKHFSLDVSRDGPFGFGFSSIMLASYLLLCGDLLNTTHVPVPEENVKFARSVITEVEDTPEGIPGVLRVHVLLTKCDYYIRKGVSFYDKASQDANDAAELASKLSIPQLHEYAKIRCRFLERRAPVKTLTNRPRQRRVPHRYKGWTRSFSCAIRKHYIIFVVLIFIAGVVIWWLLRYTVATSSSLVIADMEREYHSHIWKFLRLWDEEETIHVPPE